MPDPIVSDLLDMFPDILRVRSVLTRDGMGAPLTFSSWVDRKARVTGNIKIVRDSSGQERVSTVRAIIAGAFGVSVDDEYELPSRFSPDTPVAITVQYSTDENGAHHETVFF